MTDCWAPASRVATEHGAGGTDGERGDVAPHRR